MSAYFFTHDFRSDQNCDKRFDRRDLKGVAHSGAPLILTHLHVLEVLVREPHPPEPFLGVELRPVGASSKASSSLNAQLPVVYCESGKRAWSAANLALALSLIHI